MASITAVRYFAKLLLISLVLKLSDEKCVISRKTDSYCDSLQDLYKNDSNLTKTVFIAPDEPNNLEELRAIPVESAKDIEILTISKLIRRIPEDSFKNFTKIKRLFFYGNKITSITPGTLGNLSLTHLHFSDCQIKIILPESFKGLTQLQELRLRTNNLTEISRNIFNNLNVQTLVLSKNQISEIEKSSFAAMPNLRRLFLDNNKLTEFNVQDYVTDTSQLERLWLHGNNLTEITNYMLEGLSNLKVLNLGFNSLGNIEAGSFAATPKLTTLVLTHNSLKIVDGSILPREGLSDLRILYLDHNRLMYLSSNFLFRLSALKLMSIGGNPWQCPCLDLLLSGARPVCVMPTVRKSVCVYSYEEKLCELFRSSNEVYPAVPFCIL